MCHDRRLAIVLRKHILRFLALAVACVTDNRKSHCLITVVAAEHLLECRGEGLELRFGSKTRLNQFRLDLDSILVDLQRRAFEITRMLLGAYCRVSVVKVSTLELIESARL